MRVVVVAVGAPLYPFGTSVDDCPLGDATFGQVRARTLRALKLKEEQQKAPASSAVTGPCMLLSDELWVTKRALRAFLDVVKREPTKQQLLTLPPSRMLELTAPLQDLVRPGVFPLAYVPPGVTTTAQEAFASSAPSPAIAYRELPITLPVPHHLLGKPEATTTWPLTSSVALRVRHWLHVLRASHLAPQVWLVEKALSQPLRSALRAALGWRPAERARFASWKRAFSYVGQRSVVHPSAVVEGSVVGDDVVIGPHACVLQSVIGDGVVIEQRAHVAQSTLGSKTFVSLNSSMQACVSFAGADACANNLQACVIGPAVGLTSFARALDTVVGGEVRVEDAGALRSAGELPCGVAFGTGSYVGAGVTIAAGRALPPGVRLVGGSSVLQRVAAAAEAGSYVVVDGSLKPLP